MPSWIIIILLISMKTVILRWILDHQWLLLCLIFLASFGGSKVPPGRHWEWWMPHETPFLTFKVSCILIRRNFQTSIHHHPIVGYLHNAHRMPMAGHVCINTRFCLTGHQLPDRTESWFIFVDDVFGTILHKYWVIIMRKHRWMELKCLGLQNTGGQNLERSKL